MIELFRGGKRREVEKKNRLIEELYKEIGRLKPNFPFGKLGLVETVKELGLISRKILCHDSAFFPAFANYKDCNYATCECSCIPLKDDFQMSLLLINIAL